VDAIRAVEGFSLKLIPSRVKEDLTAKLPAMTARIEAAFVEQAAVKAGVLAILASTDQPTTSYANYYAFAWEVNKKLTQFGGGTGLVNEVALLIAKWKARGLTESVLNSIRDYFTIAEPTP
jgi:hypothetical protein